MRTAPEMKRAEMMGLLRNHGIAIDLAIPSGDRESALLHQVRSALGRIHAGSYGTGLECG